MMTVRPSQKLALSKRLLIACLTTCFISSLLCERAALARPQEVETSTLRAPQLELSGEVFGGLSYARALNRSFSAFDLSRAEVGLQSSPHAQWGGELRLESVRSAGRDSLIGVDGDSLLMRVKRAWAFGAARRGDWSAQARMGLIHDGWHEVVMSAYPLRALGPTLGEREGFQETSDLGAGLSLGWRRHRLFLTITNGEGRRYQEQNRGKDLLAGLLFSVPLSTPQQTLNLSVGYRDGSRGVSSGQNHRLYFAGWLMTPTLQLGVMGAQAWGLYSRPSLSATAAQAWILYALHPRFATLFVNGEWISYQPGSLNIVDLDGETATIDSARASASLDRVALRGGVGVSQLLYLSVPGSPSHRSGWALRIFETLEYQGESNVKSPVFGVPQLASEWRASVLMSLSWGGPPPSALPTPAPLNPPLN